jgi:hypothetical protein
LCELVLERRDAALQRLRHSLILLLEFVNLLLQVARSLSRGRRDVDDGDDGDPREMTGQGKDPHAHRMRQARGQSRSARIEAEESRFESVVRASVTLIRADAFAIHVYVYQHGAWIHTP